jgi:hypothetical protein
MIRMETDECRYAQRDGATPIDLMDGAQRADKWKELRLGIRTEMVESVEVDGEWFAIFEVLHNLQQLILGENPK